MANAATPRCAVRPPRPGRQRGMVRTLVLFRPETGPRDSSLPCVRELRLPVDIRDSPAGDLLASPSSALCETLALARQARQGTAGCGQDARHRGDRCGEARGHDQERMAGSLSRPSTEVSDEAVRLSILRPGECGAPPHTRGLYQRSAGRNRANTTTSRAQARPAGRRRGPDAPLAPSPLWRVRRTGAGRDRASSLASLRDRALDLTRSSLSGCRHHTGKGTSSKRSWPWLATTPRPEAGVGVSHEGREHDGGDEKDGDPEQHRIDDLPHVIDNDDAFTAQAFDRGRELLA
jgi:hypothetical protein